MKIIKGILALFIVALIIIQFFRIDKTNPSVNPESDFINVTKPPENIAIILRTSCYDCHSYETIYPWYSNVAPVSWWLKDHIDHAREELNFSEWDSFSEKRKSRKLEELVEEVKEEKMPLPSYLVTHGEARLTKEQIEEFTSWVQNQR